MRKSRPVNGASGTPIELFLAGIREVDQKTQMGITAVLTSRTGPVSSPA